MIATTATTNQVYPVRRTEKPFLLHYPALWIVKSNVSSFPSNEKFSPLDSAGIRIRIQKFRSNLRAVLNILCIDKGEEKEGTFHDNGGSLLVLLTSFHGQRDLENGRFIAVQRDQTSGMKPLLRGR